VVADDDDRDEPGMAGGVRARLGDPFRRDPVLPGAGEDPVLLEAEDVGVGEPRERQRDAGVEAGRERVLCPAHTFAEVACIARTLWASVPMIEIAIFGSDSSSFRNPRRGITIRLISVSATTDAERTPPSRSAISPK
jgi:hypothetical protein